MKIRLKRSREDYPIDVTRIQRVLIEAGYDCSRKDAAAVWKTYSDTMAAGWLRLPDDNDDLLTRALEVIEE